MSFCCAVSGVRIRKPAALNNCSVCLVVAQPASPPRQSKPPIASVKPWMTLGFFIGFVFLLILLTSLFGTTVSRRSVPTPPPPALSPHRPPSAPPDPLSSPP